MTRHVHRHHHALRLRFVTHNHIIRGVLAGVEGNDTLASVIGGKLDDDGWEGLLIVGRREAEVEVLQRLTGQGIEGEEFRTFCQRAAHDQGFDAGTRSHLENGADHRKGNSRCRRVRMKLKAVGRDAEQIELLHRQVVWQCRLQDIQSAGKANGKPGENERLLSLETAAGRAGGGSLFASLVHGLPGQRSRESWTCRHILGERSGTVVFRFGKGGKQRSVPLPLPARRALQAYLDSRPPMQTDRVFVGE